MAQYEHGKLKERHQGRVSRASSVVGVPRAASGVAAATGKDMEAENAALRAVLKQAKLEDYAEAFVLNGWGRAELLKTASVEALDLCGAAVGLKPGHLMRLKSVVRPDLPFIAK